MVFDFITLYSFVYVFCVHFALDVFIYFLCVLCVFTFFLLKELKICGVHGWEYSLLIGPQVHTYNKITKLLYVRQHIISVAYTDGNIPF